MMLADDEQRDAKLRLPTTGRRGQTALFGIQYLRAIAALLVVVFHLEIQLRRMGYAGGWPQGLSSGVDVFFVISGLIMWLTTRDQAVSPATFMVRRLTRIVPLYWLVTSFVVVVMLVAPSALQSGRFDVAHVIASYLFAPWPHPATGAMEPVIVAGWTLNYEMFFYVIFALFLLVGARLRLAGACGLLALLAAAGFVVGFPQDSAAGFYTAPVLIEFAAGMVLGELYLKSDSIDRIGARLGLALLIGGLIMLVSWPSLQPAATTLLTRSVPAFMMVLGVMAIETRGAVAEFRIPKLLGDASYSLYLTHPIVESAAGQVWRKLPLGGSTAALIAFSAAAIVAAVLAAILSYRLIEAPLISMFRLRRRAPAYSEAGADPR